MFTVAGGRVEYVVADVSTAQGCHAAAATAARLLGGIDVLCANAGIFPDRRLEDMTEADLDEVLGTTSRAPCSPSRPACRT